MNVEIRVVSRAVKHCSLRSIDCCPNSPVTASPLTMSQLERIVEDETTALLIAMDGENIVGCLTLAVFAIPTGVRAWIEDVVVDETLRGAGVGAGLVSFALRTANERGARTVDLTSRASRASANALYLRMGFEVRDTNVYRFFLEDR